MRRFALICCATVCATAVIGCAKSDQAAADSAAAAAATPAPPPPAPPALTLADAAGKWTMRVMPETGDSTLLTYVLTATADTSGWTVTFPGRAPIATRVAVGGDSLVMDAGPYDSALRKGQKVTTHGVSRIVDGKLVGITEARYSTKPDSVVRLRSEGTRAP